MRVLPGTFAPMYQEFAFGNKVRFAVALTCSPQRCSAAGSVSMRV